MYSLILNTYYFRFLDCDETTVIELQQLDGNVSESQSSPSRTNQIDFQKQCSSCSSRRKSDEEEKKKEAERNAKDWKNVAETMDRLFFWLFLCAIFISTLVLFHPLTDKYIRQTTISQNY